MAKKDLNFSINVPDPDQPKKANPSKAKLTEQAAALADQLPSQEDALMRAKLRDRKQMNMGMIPSFVIDLFNEGMEREGLDKTKFFYHLLRLYHGPDSIPPNERMDGRKY